MDQNKLIEEFKEKRVLYEEYILVINNLIEQLILSNPEIHFKYAFTQSRVKDINSFIENIKNEKYSDLNSIFDLKDLLGIRFGFYLERDQIPFKKILRNEFEIIEEKNKETLNEYQGYHFVLKLDEKRSKMTEYSKYKDLCFEVQLTHILSHGWNELDHDIFYKDKKEVEKRLPLVFNDLKKQSREVMEKYIFPAITAWEGLVKDYEMAEKGIVIYSPEYLITILEMKNNNDIHSTLEEIDSKSRAVGIPEGIDVDNILNIFNRIRQHVKKNKVENIVLPSFSVKGKDFEDVDMALIDLCLNLYKRNSDVVINYLIKMYLNSTTNIQKYIVDNISKISSYDLHIVGQYGFIVQNQFLNQFKKLSVKNRIKSIDLILEVSGSIFTDKVEDIQRGYNDELQAISLNRKAGTLNQSKEYENLILEYIRFNVRLFDKVESFEDKKKVINVLSRNFFSPDFTQDIFSFFLRVGKRDVNQIELIYLLREKIFLLRDESYIDRFEKATEKNIFFKDYCLSLGRAKKNFPDISWKEAQDNQADFFNSLKEKFEMGGIKKKYIESLFLQIYNSFDKLSDTSKYVNFSRFISNLTSEHPELINLFVTKRKKIPYILSNVIQGFLNSNLSYSKKYRTISSQIKKNLPSIIQSLGGAQDTNLKNKLFEYLSKEIGKIKRDKVKIEMYTSLLFSFGLKETKYKKTYLEIFEYLFDNSSYDFINFIFIQEENELVFNKFNKKEWKSFIEYMVFKKEISYSDNVLLRILSKKYPDLLIDFLLKRVFYKPDSKQDYTEIPYQDRELMDIVSDHEEALVDKFLGSKISNEDFWRLTHALQNLYPNFSGYLGLKLKEIIEKKDFSLWKKKVQPFFTWYESYKIDEIIKYTIEVFDRDEELWNICISYLLNPGSVSGLASEPILANAVSKRIDAIRSWKKKSKKVKEFIAQAEKIAERDIELKTKSHRKRLIEDKRRYS